MNIYQKITYRCPLHPTERLHSAFIPAYSKPPSLNSGLSSSLSSSSSSHMNNNQPHNTIMSRRETDEDDRAGSSLPPQPHQLLDHEKRFTPYYTTHEAAKGFPGHATAYLSSSLKYPPEQYPQPRNFYPASDPIVECRKEVFSYPLISFSFFALLSYR